MLNEFHDSKLNVDMAVTQAQNDILYRQEKLSNRIDNLMIRLGQTLLPIKEKLVGAAEWVVDRANWNVKSPDEKKQAVFEAQKRGVYEQFGGLVSEVTNMTDDQFKKNISFLQSRANEYQGVYDQKSQNYRDVGFWGTPFISHFKGFEDKMSRLDDKNNYDRQQDLGRSKAYKSLINDISEAWENRGKQPETAQKPSAGSGSSSSGGDLSGISDSLNKVVGSASAPRNITINIDAFNKGGINTQNTSLQNMDASQIEDWFTDMLMRVVNNAELSYNN